VRQYGRAAVCVGMQVRVSNGNRIWQHGPTAGFLLRVALSIADRIPSDAEDDADNWWVEWGALDERAQEAPRALAFDFGAAIATVNVQATIA
jgi:hypothetical protein